MNDLISRRAAIDAVYNCDHIFIGNMPIMVIKEDAYKALAQLPSVQPSYTNEQIQKMQELEQAEIEKAFQLGMENARSEIIRCKDCKYRGGKPIADGRCWCSIHNTFMSYCSDAERRTNETD